MTRHIFGGSSSDAAEDVTGARLPGAIGNVYDGPGDTATLLTDLLDADNAPISGLTADSRGIVPEFYGPDGVDKIWVDFGAGKVVLVPSDTSQRVSTLYSQLPGSIVGDSLVNTALAVNGDVPLPSVPEQEGLISRHVVANTDGVDITVTFDPGYRVTSAVPSRSFIVPINQILVTTAVYSTVAGAWILLDAVTTV